MTPTIRQDYNMPEIIQTLCGKIKSLFELCTQGIINTINNINNDQSDILSGADPYNSLAISCIDKMFELHLEIQTDQTPSKISQELL